MAATTSVVLYDPQESSPDVRTLADISRGSPAGPVTARRLGTSLPIRKADRPPLLSSCPSSTSVLGVEGSTDPPPARFRSTRRG